MSHNHTPLLRPNTSTVGIQALSQQEGSQFTLKYHPVNHIIILLEAC